MYKRYGGVVVSNFDCCASFITSHRAAISKMISATPVLIMTGCCCDLLVPASRLQASDL